MLLLAIDTTNFHGGVSLASNDEILETKPIHAPSGFGTVIYQEIRSLLEQHSLHLRDVDCYAAAAGPGSFTGIRIGLAVVKSLAEAHGKKVVPVSNLAALARAGGVGVIVRLSSMPAAARYTRLSTMISFGRWSMKS